MYIDMTEQELEDLLATTDSHYAVKWLMETLKSLVVPEGVYRRWDGLNMAQYFQGRWKGFSPACVSRDIVWSLYNGPQWWVMVLTNQFQPVVNGTEILMSPEGVILPETVDPEWFQEPIRRAFDREMRRQMKAGVKSEDAFELAMWYVFSVRNNLSDLYQEEQP